MWGIKMQGCSRRASRVWTRKLPALELASHTSVRAILSGKLLKSRISKTPKWLCNVYSVGHHARRLTCAQTCVTNNYQGVQVESCQPV